MRTEPASDGHTQEIEMRHIVPSEFSDSSLADLDRLIAIAGGHAWTMQSVKTYMKAEAKKLRPNWLYYFAKSLFFMRQPDLGYRIESACLLSMAAGVLSFCAGFCMVVSALNTRDLFLGAQGCLAVIAGAGLFALGFRYFFSLKGYEILGPGYWKTEKYNPTLDDHYAPKEVRSIVSRLYTIIPDAKFEISLLYRDEFLFDPVLWLVLDAGETTVRLPFAVWGTDYKVVLPPR